LKKFVNLSDELGGPVAEQVCTIAGCRLEEGAYADIRLRAFYVHLLDSANSSSLRRKRRNLIWPVLFLCNS
jgi:hypothetical protein